MNMMDPLSALGAAVGALLKERKQTVAVAESSAGGLINASIVAVPGASVYYLGGAVIYTAASRGAFLGVGPEDMRGIRSASEPFARLLAQRVREKTGATWGIAETGASGPAGNRYGDAPGHACVAIAGPVEAAAIIETGSDDREANKDLLARTGHELVATCMRQAAR